MNKLFFLFFFFIAVIFGNTVQNPHQNKTNALASISASSLFNLDKEQLQNGIQSYLQVNQEIKAVEVFDTLTQEKYLTIYHNKNKFEISPLPQKIQKLASYTSNIIYENDTIGKLVTYIEQKPNLKLTQNEKVFFTKQSYSQSDRIF